MKSVEVQLNEAYRSLNEALDVIASLKTVIHQKQITIAALQRDGRLKEARLHPASVVRLHEAFAISTDNAGLKEAINVEKRKAGVQ